MKPKFIISTLAILILLFAVQPIRTRVVENLSEIPNITNLKNVVYMIAFDESGSMAPYFQEAKKSLIRHLDTMGSNDVLYLFTFGTDTKALISDKNPVSDKEEIKTKVSSIRMVYKGWTYITKMLEVTNEKQFEINKKYRFHNKLFIVYSDNVNDPPPQFREQDRVDLGESFRSELFNGWGKFFLETPSEKIQEKEPTKIASLEDKNTKSSKEGSKGILNKNINSKKPDIKNNNANPLDQTKEDLPQPNAIESDQSAEELNMNETNDSVAEKKEPESNTQPIESKKESSEQIEEESPEKNSIPSDKNVYPNPTEKQAITKKQLQQNILSAYLGATVLKLNNKDTDRVFQMITSSYGYLELFHFTITLFLVVYLVHILAKHFFSQFYKEIEVFLGIIAFLFLADFFNLIKGISNAIRLIPNLVHSLFSLIPGVENYTAIFLFFNLLLSVLFYFMIIFLYKKYKRPTIT